MLTHITAKELAEFDHKPKDYFYGQRLPLLIERKPRSHGDDP